MNLCEKNGCLGACSSISRGSCRKAPEGIEQTSSPALLNHFHMWVSVWLKAKNRSAKPAPQKTMKSRWQAAGGTILRIVHRRAAPSIAKDIAAVRIAFSISTAFIAIPPVRILTTAHLKMNSATDIHVCRRNVESFSKLMRKVFQNMFCGLSLNLCRFRRGRQWLFVSTKADGLLSVYIHSRRSCLAAFRDGTISCFADGD